MDVGSSKSLIAQNELNRIKSSPVRYKIQTEISKNSFKLGNKTTKSSNCLALYLKAPAYMDDISVVFDIVLVDIPELLRPDVLEDYVIFADTVNSQLVDALRSRTPTVLFSIANDGQCRLSGRKIIFSHNYRSLA